MGYHKRSITKGKIGEFSKIEEEMQELLDAHEQGIKVMELIELSDLLGAIEAYIKKHDLTLADLVAMMEKTKEAFKDGTRK